MAQGLGEVTLAGLDTIILAIDRAKAPGGIVSKASIALVSDVAVSGRSILMDSFTSQQGELRYNSPLRPHYRKKRKNKAGELVARHREPLIFSKAGYYDSRGPKAGLLINVTLKSRGAGTKIAKLSSYPMNLWERNTKTGRPGKWIMTVRLAPLVEERAPKYMERAANRIDSEMQKEMEGK